MKISFISQNPFGLQGTPGTYKLIESFDRNAELIVFASKPERLIAEIVYQKENAYPLHEVNYNIKEERQQMIDRIISNKPDIIYFCSGQLWRDNNAEIIKKIKKELPSTKFVLDIKSPPLIDNNLCAEKFREESSVHQNLLDKIFSRSLEDVEDWIADLQSDVVIYPLGVSTKDFLPKISKDKNIICKRFVYIGALHKRRQIEKMFFWVANLPPKIKSVFHLDVFGSGPYFEDTKRIIENKNLKDTITLNPSINQKQLFKILPNYDAGIGWVPYESYDYAPSLKSLEYIAAGLVSFVSDTIAHQRMYESGFELNFFSNDQKSFTNSLNALCFEGFPSTHIKKNLELIKDHDWDAIVDNYFFPELEKLISNSGASNKSNLKFESKQALLTISNKLVEKERIFFFFESENMINYVAQKLIIDLVKHDYSIGIGYPSDKGNKSVFNDPNRRIYYFPWDTINVSINEYRNNVMEFSPNSIVVFYWSGDIVKFYNLLFDTKIPVVLSERAMPQRVLISNWANLFQISIHEAAWQREMILANASIIHLTHKNYIKFIPDYLCSRTHIFSDNSENYIKYVKKGKSGSAVDLWKNMIEESIDKNKPNLKLQQYEGMDYERLLHAKRMRDKLLKQYKG